MALKKTAWSADRKQILELINSAIDGGFSVTLQNAGGKPVKSKIVAIRMFRKIPYLVLTRPQGLQDSRMVQDLFLKIRGLPILGFSCPITREGAGVIATMLPQAVYQLELRESARLSPKKGSMATFFIKDRSRVSICMMENISLSGGKLTGTPTHLVRPDDFIGPCTLSLAGRDSLIDREVTLNSAIVARVVLNDGAAGQIGLGVRFLLNDSERQVLSEQLEIAAKL